MGGKFFEFKIKVINEEEAKDKLKLLNLGEPNVKNIVDTYFVTDSNTTEKIYVSGAKIFHTIVISTKDGFEMKAEPISQEVKEKLLKEKQLDKVMKKHRKVWEVNGIDVAIDEVEELGTFIEFQGRERQKVLDLIRSLGISEKQFIKTPYNKL